MKLDLFGERWLMQLESISQLFGSVGSPSALRVRGSVQTTYTSGSVATCLVETCSVVACMPVSVHSPFFFSLYACFSAQERWCISGAGVQSFHMPNRSAKRARWSHFSSLSEYHPVL